MFRNHHVRVALSTVIAKLSPILGKEKSLEKLVPLVVRLLKDEVCWRRLRCPA